MPVALHDVFRLDARPHHDAIRCQAGAHLSELQRERTLRRVDDLCSFEQRVAFGVVRGPLVGSARHAPIPSRKARRWPRSLRRAALRAAGVV
jgi:hypothetical protein